MTNGKFNSVWLEEEMDKFELTEREELDEAGRLELVKYNLEKLKKEE